MFFFFFFVFYQVSLATSAGYGAKSNMQGVALATETGVLLSGGRDVTAGDTNEV